MEKSLYITSGKKFRVPAGMESLGGYPLYLLIAAWGLHQNQVLTTALVCRTFFITQSQARDALHYIRHEGRLRVRSEFSPVVDRTQLYCKGVRILSVDLSEGPFPGKIRQIEVTTRKDLPSLMPRQTREGSLQRQLRQWMVSRRPGERVPHALLAVDRDN